MYCMAVDKLLEVYKTFGDTGILNVNPPATHSHLDQEYLRLWGLLLLHRRLIGLHYQKEHH